MRQRHNVEIRSNDHGAWYVCAACPRDFIGSAQVGKFRESRELAEKDAKSHVRGGK